MLSILPRVRLVHRGDLASDGRPLEFAAEGFAAALALILLPFEELVARKCQRRLKVGRRRSAPNLRKAQVRLDDYVQAPGAHVAVCARERQAQLVHHLGDTDGC